MYEFICPGCGYKAYVSGGRDCGFISVIETRMCKNCKNVVDVIVDDTSSKVQDGEIWSCACPHGGVIEDLDEIRDRCPLCKSITKGAWNGRCPKCGSKMEKGHLTINWD